MSLRFKPDVIRATSLAVLLTLSGLSMSACVEGGRSLYGGADYGLYYDNYYGPVSYGYWGVDGLYYYRDERTQNYMRDEAHHFRRDAAEGYTSTRMHAARDRSQTHDQGRSREDSHQDGR